MFAYCVMLVVVVVGDCLVWFCAFVICCCLLFCLVY